MYETLNFFSCFHSWSHSRKLFIFMGSESSKSLKVIYHWARVVGYGPFSLCVIHMEGLCLRSGDSNRLMMMNKYRSVSALKMMQPKFEC
jgi:hypothetical protein